MQEERYKRFCCKILSTREEGYCWVNAVFNINNVLKYICHLINGYASTTVGLCICKSFERCF